MLSVQDEEETNPLDFLDQVEDNDRGARAVHVNDSALDLGGQQKFGDPRKLQANDDGDREFDVMRKEELSLNFLTSASPPVDLWNACLKYFEEAENLDPEINETAKLAYGHFYDAPRECKFMAGVYKMQESDASSVVDFKRLSGDAFLMQDFFKMIGPELAREGVVDLEDDEEEDSSSFEFSDEDMDGFDFMDPHKSYLEFQYDDGLLSMWVERFEQSTMEDKDYVMNMMSFNAEHEGNRAYMIEKVGDALVKLIKVQLMESKEWNTAPITRNTCMLLKNLYPSDIEIDDDMIKAIFNTMKLWCPSGNTSGKAIGEVRESRQSMILLSEVLMRTIDDEKRSSEDILNIMKDTLDETQINKLVKFSVYRDEEHLSSFGQLASTLLESTN